MIQENHFLTYLKVQIQMAANMYLNSQLALKMGILIGPPNNFSTCIFHLSSHSLRKGCDGKKMKQAGAELC